MARLLDCIETDYYENQYIVWTRDALDEVLFNLQIHCEEVRTAWRTATELLRSEWPQDDAFDPTK